MSIKVTKEQFIGATYDELLAENAKLRELVRHMRCCMLNEYTEIGLDFIATHCEYCEYDNDCGLCDFEQRMAELGIEVDE